MSLLPDNVVVRDGIQYLKLPTNEQLAMTGVPKEESGYSFESWRPDVPGITDELRESIRWMVTEWDKGSGVWAVVLSGPAGRGKTHLAVSTLGRVVSAIGVTACRYVRWLRLLQDIRDSWRDGGTETILLQDIDRARFLVLDDLGTEADEKSEGVPQWIVQRAFAVLEARHRKQAGTLITTNLSQRIMTARYGERFVSRLYGGGVWITFPDAIPDQRQGGTS